MQIIKTLIDFILHIDVHLTEIIKNYGTWTYLILFVILFSETGLVFFPFLPGDSLLFATGALAALGSMNIAFIHLLLCVAVILGDTVNYTIGKKIGLKIFDNNKIPFLKKEYLVKTENFYEKHGKKTIVIARYVPIVRTFAPFVAGVGQMKFKEFISYSVIGGVTWLTLFLYGGFFFGNFDIVKKNFSIVIFAIIFISILPGIIGYLKSKYGKKAEIQGE